jgi:hypothetical protein
MWVSFYRPSDEDGYSRDAETTYLTLVDAEGRALWGIHLGDSRLTMGALRRAHDAGLINGDPNRPHLLVRPAYGNGVLPDWSDLVAIYLVISQVIGTIADGRDAVSVAAWTRDRARRILDRVRRTPEVLEDKAPDWTSRNGWPHELDRMIRSRLWKSEELAQLLDLPVPDVEALLAGRGMTRDTRTGYWHMGEDPESRIVNEVYSIGLVHETTTINDAGELEKVRKEIRRVVTRGMEPDVSDGSAQ